MVMVIGLRNYRAETEGENDHGIGEEERRHRLIEKAKTALRVVWSRTRVAGSDKLPAMKLIFGKLAATAVSWGQGPSVAVFQQVLQKQYPFSVTGLIRDYGPGCPANRFYGDTCIGRMEGFFN